MSKLENVERIIVVQEDAPPPKTDKLTHAQQMIVEGIDMIREVRNTKLGMRVRSALREVRKRRKNHTD